MKRLIFNYLAVAALAALTALTSCSGTSMKGTTYVNSSAANKPMVFETETAGVLKFVDNKKVDILFPYAIDTKNFQVQGSIGGSGVSSELWVPGEYKKNGSTITVSFKLSKDQKEPGVLEVQVKDDGKTLVGEQGESFNKIDK